MRALDVLVRGMTFEKKLESTRQEEKMEAILESEKFEGIVTYMPKDHNHKIIRTWLKARFDARGQLEEERRASSKAPSMVFSSQNLPEVPSDGKGHEPKVWLLQCKVLQAIRALPDTPAKSINSIRKAFWQVDKTELQGNGNQGDVSVEFLGDRDRRYGRIRDVRSFPWRVPRGSQSFRDARRAAECLLTGFNPDQGRTRQGDESSPIRE